MIIGDKMNGIGKISHRSHILHALDIPSASACVNNVVLCNIIFKLELHIRRVCAYVVSQFITKGK